MKKQFAMLIIVLILFVLTGCEKTELIEDTRVVKDFEGTGIIESNEVIDTTRVIKSYKNIEMLDATEIDEMLDNIFKYGYHESDYDIIKQVVESEDATEKQLSKCASYVADHGLVDIANTILLNSKCTGNVINVLADSAFTSIIKLIAESEDATEEQLLKCASRAANLCLADIANTIILNRNCTENVINVLANSYCADVIKIVAESEYATEEHLLKCVDYVIEYFRNSSAISVADAILSNDNCTEKVERKLEILINLRILQNS